MKVVNRIEEVLESKKDLINYLTRPSPIRLKESRVPNSLLINIAARKFNEKFDGLSTADKKKFKDLYSQDTQDLNIEYDKNIKEITTKLDNLIDKTSDDNLISKLKETKQKINEGRYSKKSLFKIKEFNATLLS